MSQDDDPTSTGGRAQFPSYDQDEGKINEEGEHAVEMLCHMLYCRADDCQ
jgi:hypothetical protein